MRVEVDAATGLVRRTSRGKQKPEPGTFVVETNAKHDWRRVRWVDGAFLPYERQRVPFAAHPKEAKKRELRQRVLNATTVSDLRSVLLDVVAVL